MTETGKNNPEHRLEEAVHSFLEAQSRGAEPDIDEFVKAYPDLALQIRQRILDLRRIETLFDSLVQAEESDFDGLAPEKDLVGQTIGGFEVVEIIGRGGMGVVYLARDTNLDRSVAIKSLTPGQPGAPLSHTRFRREAKLLASLNHSNIAIIHEIIEQADGSGYLILEYIPGETLAQRIAREPIEPMQALAIGQQIAEALAAAHEKGVIHRDLKPGNIKITPEGKVKVLDFGLAKAAVDEDSEKDITVTQPGRVMGTPAYMSPEQARGQPVDKRSDIWSFGCVLYEMLTGVSPFAGDTVSDTLAHTLQTEPDWQAVPQTTPSNIRVLLRRCLEKDPRRRLRDVGDAAIEISETLSGTAESLALPKEVGGVSRLFRRKVVLLGAACLIAGALIAGVLVASLMRPNSPRVLRTSISVPPDKRLVWGDSPTSCLAVSPDGTRLVYVGKTDEGENQLYVRYMENLEIEPIRGTEGAGNPFFSPNGDRVGFFTPDLKVVSLDGGEPQTLREDVGHVAFGSWADDGTIVFSAIYPGQGLQQISDDGDPSGILKVHMPDVNDMIYGFPQVLPGSKTILYSRFAWAKQRIHESRIEAYSPKTGSFKLVLDNAHYARYVESGHLIFLRNYVLMAIRFNIKTLKPTGTSVVLTDSIGLDWQGRTPQFADSRDGTLVYLPKSDPDKTLEWVNRQGEVIRALEAPAGEYMAPRLSPDGQYVAVENLSRQDYNVRIQVYNTEPNSGSLIPLAMEGHNSFPAWSPDGKEIAFRSRRSEGSGIFCRAADASTPAELRVPNTPSGAKLEPYSWSREGNLLACMSRGGVLIVDMGTLDKRRPFLNTGHRKSNPAFSPDGRWLAYSSKESGQPEVYLQECINGGQLKPVSSGGGKGPVWSRDGRELFYLSDRDMMVVKITTEPRLSIGTPEKLFTNSYVGADNLHTHYDISPDGNRFLMIKRKDNPIAQLICVQNWFEELNRLVPKGKY